MSYQIIGDSCLDLNQADKKKNMFKLIPLTLQVEDQIFIDDDTFSQKDFLKAVSDSPASPKSACPSPHTFLEAYKKTKADMIFVVTLSSKLSGSYNSACVAKNMYKEDCGCDSKKIAVFSSDSASCGETLIAFRLKELAESGLNFDSIVEKSTDFINNMKTYFVLESLETLRKNGRLTGIKAFFASALNIKPIMGATGGNIVKLDQARGINKALDKMSSILVSEIKDSRQRTLAIAHCNCPERAEYVKRLLLQKGIFQDIYITETAGVSTMYANDGGIIVCC